MSLHDILRALASRTPFADEMARQQVLSAIDEHERQAAAPHEEPHEILPVTGISVTRTPPVPPAYPPSPEGM